MRKRSGTVWTGMAVSLVAVVACGSESPVEPDPTPVDQPIVFVDNGAVRTASDSGGDAVTLMENTPLYALAATWSPTGTHLLVWLRDEARDRKLYVMNADGSSPVEVSNLPDNVDGPGAWSSDGTRVAFFTDGLDLYVVNRDGTARTEVTPGDHVGQDPHWAPADDWIVYEGGDSTGQGVVRVRPDGTGHERLADAGLRLQPMSPRYSPDGTRIAFVIGQDIHLMDADGANQAPLTLTPSSGDWHPRWSPDGTLIAYHVDAGSNWGIGVIDVSTGFMVDTLRAGSDALYPSWAPDGDHLTFEISNNVIVGAVSDADAWASIERGSLPDWHPGR